MKSLPSLFVPLLMVLAVGCLHAGETGTESPAPSSTAPGGANPEPQTTPAIEPPPATAPATRPSGFSPVPDTVKIFINNVYRVDPGINAKILIPDEKLAPLEDGLKNIAELQAKVYKLSRDKTRERSPDDPTSASVIQMRKELFERTFSSEQLALIEQVNRSSEEIQKEAAREAGLAGLKKGDPLLEEARNKQKEIYNERFAETLQSLIPEPVGGNHPTP